MYVQSSLGEGEAEEPSCVFITESGEMHDLPQLMPYGPPQHSTAPVSTLSPAFSSATPANLGNHHGREILSGGRKRKEQQLFRSQLLQDCLCPR